MKKDKIDYILYGLVFISIFISIRYYITNNIKNTYSIDENKDFLVTFHQAWGDDNNPSQHSSNLPKWCTTRYGKIIFESCINEIGICAKWCEEANFPTSNVCPGGMPIPTYNIKYDKIDRNIEYYCKTNTSTGGNGSPQNLTKIKVKKIWQDNNNSDGLRPKSVTVELYVKAKDGYDLGINGPIYVKKLDNSNWEYEFTDLPVSIKSHSVEYYIKEQKVQNYTTKIDGYNITNIYIPEVVNINGSVEWQDVNNIDKIRPNNINVKLYKNGSYIQTINVTNNNWNFSFKNLPKYSNGKYNNYTIETDKINNYRTTINGFDIINKHEPNIIIDTKICDGSGNCRSNSGNINLN